MIRVKNDFFSLQALEGNLRFIELASSLTF